VGGDFYDLIDLSPTSWLVVVGDVCGKGPEAAAVMGYARASIRAAAQKDADPTAILTTLNQALLSQGGERFATVACVRLDRDGDQVRACSVVGGHPRPVIVPASGSPRTIGGYGTVLGVFPDVELHAADVLLRPGDALVLYTDGLEGVERSAEDVVVACLADLERDGSARTVVRALEAVREASPRAAMDDLAMLAVAVPD
jgi:serine phosphatase RsbU (regulator of sigma subunit)